jgi:hypothetical protein
MGLAHATRDLRRASEEQLTVMRDAAALLMEHQRRISPRALTELCLIREEAAAELSHRIRAVACDSGLQSGGRVVAGNAQRQPGAS